jgi:hypothetical protein
MRDSSGSPGDCGAAVLRCRAGRVQAVLAGPGVGVLHAKGIREEVNMGSTTRPPVLGLAHDASRARFHIPHAAP